MSVSFITGIFSAGVVLGYKFKGTVHPKDEKYIFLLLPVELFISKGSFGVSCLVLETTDHVVKKVVPLSKKVVPT